MGLKNIFNRKKEDFTNYDCNDFAREFKLAYEKDDIKMMNTSINNWYDIGENDANLKLAIVLLAFKEGRRDYDVVYGMVGEAFEMEAVDFRLFDWYKSTAMTLIQNQWASLFEKLEKSGIRFV